MKRAPGGITAQIIHLRDWTSRPLVPPAACSCGRDTVLTVGQRLERRRIVIGAAVCMDCGDDATGTFDVATSLDLAMAAFGWNPEVVRRLHALVAHRRADIDVDHAPRWIQRSLAHGEVA